MQTLSFNPIQNVYVLNYQPNVNHSGDVALYVGRFQSSTGIYRSLLQFDISSIPIGSTILEARLKLYIYLNPNPDIAKPIQVFRLLDYFNEDTVTFNNQPQVLNTAAATTVINNELNTTITWEITNLAIEWHNGSVPNTGIMLIGVEDENALTGYRSDESNDSRRWPFLEIDFEEGITTQLATENVNTSDSFMGSSAIELGPKKVTFGINNTGATNNAEVKLQISPDGTTWIDNKLPYMSLATIGPGESITLNIDGNMASARVAYRNQISGQSTSLAIYPATTESI